MPLLKFDMQAGMTAPDASELREAAAKNWQLAFRRDGLPTIDTDPSTPAGQLVDAEAAYLAQLNSELLFFFSQLNPRTAEGPWQDALAKIYFLTRKIAQPTQAAVVCSGLPGTVIPRGAQIRDENNSRYECVQDATIPESGTVTVYFRNLEAGPKECPANSLMNYTFQGGGEIVSNAGEDGWKYITNEEAGTPGDSETPTTVSVLCGGIEGALIKPSAVIRDRSGATYCPVPDGAAPAIGESGTVEVLFRRASMDGTPVNGALPCPAESLSNMRIEGTGSIVTVVPGWDMIRNPRQGVKGWHRESQWDFETRRYDSVAKNSHGAVESLLGAIWDVEDVVDCVVLENATGERIEKHGIWIPAHSVAICVFGGAGPDIARAIYMKKDAGCGTDAVDANGVRLENVEEVSFVDEEYGAEYSYRILRPAAVKVGIEITVNQVASTPSNAKQLIRDAVLEDFYGNNQDSGYRRVGAAQTVYASRFAVAVVKTAGIPDLVGIRIRLGGEMDPAASGWGGEIVIDAATEPTLEEDRILVNLISS